MNNFSDIQHTKLALPLWERIFMVRVPQLDSTNTQYIKFFGTPTTGDKDIDQALANQPLTIYINIDKMVEYYRRNVRVAVVRRDDVKVIYDLIQAYLDFWKRKLAFVLHPGSAPMDDLIMLDRFAQAVHDSIRYEIHQQESMSPFESFLFNRFKALPIGDTTITGPVATRPEDIVPAVREGYSDEFKAHRKQAFAWRSRLSK
jgi:hypothetical protein